MYNRIEVYKIWAPDDALWTEWVKPVLFSNGSSGKGGVKFTQDTNWISKIFEPSVIIVDLPGELSVKEGLAIAKNGYRPIPLYNGVDESGYESVLVNTKEIAAALFEEASTLRTLELRKDAPPVFLLDSDRMKGWGNRPGTYDNRWSVFPQDMPSAAYLLSKGIKQVIVRSQSVRDDLSHVLCRYQEKGIDIFLCDEYETIEKIEVSTPFLFKSLFYRFKTMSGLVRNAAGGFGGAVPDAVESKTSHRHYGVG